MTGLVPLRLRPAETDDARLAADLETRARPAEPVDPPSFEYRLLHPGVGGPPHVHLVLEAEEPVGVVDFRHPEGRTWEQDRVTTVELTLIPEARAMAREALDLLEGLAREDRPRQLRAWSLDDAYLDEAFAATGYRHVRSSIAQDLDLVSGRERLLAMREGTRERMSRQGIALRPGHEVPAGRLREEGLRLFNTTQADIPHSVEDPDLDPAEMERDLQAPSFHLDRFWTAWDGDRMVALSFLAFPVERGHVWTGYTASDRSHRGRGIAQAVKNESVGQAIELGVPRIRTDNDAENGPMLAINRKLGYSPVYTTREWLKALG